MAKCTWSLALRLSGGWLCRMSQPSIVGGPAWKARMARSLLYPGIEESVGRGGGSGSARGQETNQDQNE
eukprot:4235916-Pyramimonas_sp.AAC.1